MAGATLGFLKFVLAFDTIAFKKGMTQAEKDLVGLQKKVEKFGKSMGDIGKSMSLAITAPLTGFAYVAVKEAQETATALGKVNNALSQTGAVAGQTTPKLKAAAEAFETKSLYEADEILNQVTATLLRFGQILPQNFQAAQQAAVDLAAATGAPLESAATLVGKALIAPAKASKALAAIGITLDKAQIKQLETWNKTGQAARTQAVVLGLLESRIKGAALAAQNADPFNRLIDAFKKLAEEVGVILIPVLAKIGAVISPIANGFASLNPFVKDVIVSLLALAAAAGPALVVMGKITEIAAKNPELVKFAKSLFSVAEGSRAAAAGAALMNIGLGPILLILGALAIAVTAVVVAWDNWDKITAFVMEVYNVVKKFILDNLGKVWTAVKTGLASVVNAFKGLLNAVPWVAGLVKAVYHWYVDYLGGVWKFVKKSLDTVVGWFMSAFNFLKKILAPVAKIIGGAFSRAFSAIGESFGGVEGKVADVKSNLQGSLSGVDLGLDAAVDKTGKKAKGKAKDTVAEAAKEFKSLMDGIFPERAAVAEYEGKLAKLKAAQDAGKLSADQYAEAVDRLGVNFRDLPDEPPDWWSKLSSDAFTATGAFAPIDVGAANAFADIKEQSDKGMEQVAEATKSKTKEMAEAWRDMANKAIESMKGMVDAFQSGDILGGIQKVLDLVLELASSLSRLGVFGKGAQTAFGGAPGSTAAYGGARAMGGPVVPGKAYTVGENGPEFFSTKRRGFIHPSGNEAQSARVTVIPSPYFDVVVDRRAAAVAAPMAGQAAIIGVTGSEQRMARRSRRNLYATG